MKAFRKFNGPVLLAGLLVVLPPPLVQGADGGQDAAQPPPPPPGFKSPQEVLQAIGAGKVKLITPTKELPEGVVEIKDLEYGKVGERSLKLDLYLPEKRTKSVPGLIFIHGGAWSGGTRDVYRYYTVRYAQRGYVAATISYRLSGEAPFPAAVEDAKCAVRWLRSNAARYQVDPNKIGVIGGSAGGHLAMMVGYSSDLAQLEGNGGHVGVSSRVQAVVDFYGPYDLTTPFARTNRAVVNFLQGKTYDEAPGLFRQASPATYLTKDDPPTLIFHGTIDDTVPIDQADALARKLADLGIPYVYDRLEGWPHAMDLAEAVNERCQFLMNQFFAKHLPLPK
jgi:acetyl esterase/lipase